MFAMKVEKKIETRKHSKLKMEVKQVLDLFLITIAQKRKMFSLPNSGVTHLIDSYIMKEGIICLSQQLASV